MPFSFLLPKPFLHDQEGVSREEDQGTIHVRG
jgi:hypothetical protein